MTKLKLIVILGAAVLVTGILLSPTAPMILGDDDNDNDNNDNDNNDDDVQMCGDGEAVIGLIDDDSIICALFVGQQGPPGEQGPPGADGDDGLNCWDLNGNGAEDVATEDTNGDGAVNVNDCKGPKGDKGDTGDTGPAGPAADSVCPRDRVQHWDKILFKINDDPAIGIGSATFQEIRIFQRAFGGGPVIIDHTLDVKLLDQPNRDFNLNEKVLSAVAQQGGIQVVIGAVARPAVINDVVIIDAKYEIVCVQPVVNGVPVGGAGCPADSVQHWDKILYKFRSTDPITHEIKLLDTPDRVFDLNTRVGTFEGKILDAKYEIVCASP